MITGTPSGWYPDPESREPAAPPQSAGFTSIRLWAFAGLLFALLVAFWLAEQQPDTPPEQRDVLEAIERARASDTDNAVRYQQIKQARDEEICGILGPRGDVRGWTGTVEQVGTTLSGSGTLTLSIGSGVEIGTATSLLTDLGRGTTTIDDDDPLYEVLGQVDSGDRVVFDGTFALQGECSVLDTGDLREPVLTIRFTRITPK